MKRWINLLETLRARFFERAIPDEDLEQMQSWRISAQLAAVPPNYIEQVPCEVAALIRSAKALHPRMAAGAIDRESDGEPCPDLG